MNENSKCPKCGATIAPEWKHELCPGCLMQAGLPTDVAALSERGYKDDETRASNNAYVPPPNEPLSIEDVRRLFSQLEIIEQVGKGGMGVVYKARQPQLDRVVALKLLPADLARTPGFSDRFSREARALAKLSHPNIVSVFDYGVTAPPPSHSDGGTPSLHAGSVCYFIMEFVDGANLRQMIASKQISPEAALTIVPKVCEALQFAHDEGILHRDIKPENILIDKKGRVKIADFGLAKLVDDQTTDHSLTGTQQIMGTPRYMAPEQFENTKTVDHRADIYSLGVVFYEMLTGEIPMGRFAPPSKKVQVDVRIDEVVLKSLEREPQQRYQHVSDIKIDVDNITHRGAGASLPPQEQRGHPARDGGGMPPRPATPQLCKQAIISAVWAMMGPACAAPVFYMYLWAAHPESPELPRNMTQLLWVLIPFSLLAFSAPLGATITGAAAIGRIRKSNGQLTGLPFAAFAALFYPLLILGFLVAATTMFVWGAFFEKPGTAHAPVPEFVVGLCAIIFGAWFAWRKIAGPMVSTVGTSRDANCQSLEKPLDHRVSEVVTKRIPGWFNARAKWVQSLVQTVLLVVFLIGLVAFMGFSFRASSAPGQSEKVITFGMPAPWLEIVNGTKNFQWMIHPFAPSVVLALLGAAAAFLYEMIRRSRPGFDAEKDRRSTRRWVISMGLVIAAIIAAAVMLTMRKPVPAMHRAVITEDASADAGAASGVHRMFRYHVSAPVDHRASFWVEYWRDGKLDKKVGLTGGQMRQLPSRAAFEGGFDFSLADGSKTSPDAAGKVRWDFNVSSRLRDWVSSNGAMKVNDDASRGGHGDWIADPFAGLDVVSSWGKTRKWNVAIGEPVTVLVLCGYARGENLSAGLHDEDAKQGKATILLRARFDAVPPGERVEHSQTKSLNAEDVEKLGGAAGVAIEAVDARHRRPVASLAGKGDPHAEPDVGYTNSSGVAKGITADSSVNILLSSFTAGMLMPHSMILLVRIGQIERQT